MRQAWTVGLLMAGALASGALRAQDGALPSTAQGAWPEYNGDGRGSRYSPLDQIDASNFSDLELAWRFKTDNLGNRPEYKLEGTPLMVGGTLYTTAGSRRAAVALDGETGELRWMWSLDEGLRAALSPRQLSGRGLAYWTDGRGDDRVLMVTTGYRLVALDAVTGIPIESFGDGGLVDLKVGVTYGRGEQIDLETGEIGLHSTPLVAGDRVIVGSAFKEGGTIQSHSNTKGLVRAFDARTGELDWTFHTIPRPGEFGNDTWLDDSWATNGNAGVWTQMSVDEELGLLYLPVESPTSDYYGGMRPGENLFGESLVCVDLATGERKWHFQFVHHPIWDHDIPSAPILADITVDGRDIKAVAVPTKQAFLYVFDRVTGEPVWPIEETPMPAGDVPGEWYSPTQPIPTKPPMYGRSIFYYDDVIDFTPELREEALGKLKRYRVAEGKLFNPPTVSEMDGLWGGINLGYNVGGSNWPGGGYDPETHRVFVPANTSHIAGIGLAPPPPGYSDMPYLLGTVGLQFRAGRASGSRNNPDAPPPPAARHEGVTASRRERLDAQGLPILKPPYGVLAAIDLDRGEIAWRVAHGETPDNVRHHPLLADMEVPKTGQFGSVGLLVTKTLVVMGDPRVTTTDDHPRGAMLRAYDKSTGSQVGEVWMPAPQSGSPMTYALDGQQYIVVAVSGGNYSGEYLAFRLPPSE